VITDKPQVPQSPSSCSLERVADFDFDVIVQTDVHDSSTKARELFDRLARASSLESLGSLAVGIAHDFNNMLSAIIGFGEVLRESIPPGSEAASDLSELMKAATSAAAMTRYLLAFGKPQMLAPRHINVSAHLGALVPILSRLIGSSITIVLETPNEVPLWVDPHQLDQAIVNLVLNARDAMPNGGTIRIDIRNVELRDSDDDCQHGCAAGAYVCVAVTDEGTGMDAGTCARVFEPFFTTKSERGGTGLGLPSVYSFLKQSHGAVLLDSELGQGTTVRLCFPSVAADQGRDSAPAIRLSQLRAAKTASILLVERDELVRKAARRILELNGYRVTEAADSNDALARLNDSSLEIDLLLAAMQLPNLSAVELARRTLDVRPRIGVVLMSGTAGMHDVRTAAAELRALIVEKPFTTDTLVTRVQQALAASSTTDRPGDA
jgi:nitrogen-specific signal transduction histidine kinase/ActR/RegA family two-component response regulator